ncbi:OCIA domain-containing protein 2-like isoform X2 [Denticeps clupeoides]|uniref:OCIA domain-containing protein 2-like isoform X2 n=1 Tax=Denticeps clupeoides TaxID=299321 RepID=UPI0010A3144A|nr:OCIA domain-containing protein 2-like isoform X2 [Denticeps clupeoides]XP_028844776.1 OCIA domain-containing protein 2-like isoform X2 [Denticeps clupeoides]
MSSEATEGSVAVESKEAAPGSQKKCGKGHIQREEVRKIWRECQEESFWYRALPLSLGSMTVTGALIYQGVWKTSVRFGPFPKLACTVTMCVKNAKNRECRYHRLSRAIKESWNPSNAWNCKREQASVLNKSSFLIILLVFY